MDITIEWELLCHWCRERCGSVFSSHVPSFVIGSLHFWKASFFWYLGSFILPILWSVFGDCQQVVGLDFGCSLCQFGCLLDESTRRHDLDWNILFLQRAKEKEETQCCCGSFFFDQTLWRCRQWYLPAWGKRGVLPRIVHSHTACWYDHHQSVSRLWSCETNVGSARHGVPLDAVRIISKGQRKNACLPEGPMVHNLTLGLIVHWYCYMNPSIVVDIVVTIFLWSLCDINRLLNRMRMS